MTHRVVYTAAALADLAALSSYIADETSLAIATRFIKRVVARCDSLENFPMRGTKRDDILPALRILAYRKRTLIAFTVGRDEVTILAVVHGAQDYGALLQQS